MPTSCAELQAKLAEAEAALHAARMGQKIVMTRQGEKQIQYGPLNLADLEKYVGQLRDQVARCTGDTTRLRRRVIGVIPHDGNEFGPCR